jgi:hypothetical protein
MLQALDIRDALEAERFLQVHFDPISEPALQPMASNDPSGSDGLSIANTPPPILSPTMWAESDASAFKVRGLSYNTDKTKVSSGPSLFKLLAIDFFEVPETTPNISAHPRNRVALAHQRGDPTWVFVLNIMVPGPPYLSFVAYFEGDKVYFYFLVIFIPINIDSLPNSLN